VVPALLAVLAGVVTEVPVDPDAETARRWAEQELADPIYHQGESLLQVVLRWIQERLAEAQNALSTMNGRSAAIVLGSVVIIGVVVTLLVVGPVRRSRRSQRSSVEVFVDDNRTVAELRRSADTLAAAGQWSEAVLDRFRAILRSLEKRAVVDERPGRTAHEAAVQAAAVLPPCAADLHRASRMFDDVCYGDVEARRDDDAWLRQVDDAVQNTRPVAAATGSQVLVAPR